MPLLRQCKHLAGTSGISKMTQREWFKKRGGKTTTDNMGQCNEMFFSFVFCTFFKIFHVCLGKKSKSVSFSRVYVCVKAKLTLVSFFYFFLRTFPLVLNVFQFYLRHFVICNPLDCGWHGECGLMRDGCS